MKKNTRKMRAWLVSAMLCAALAAGCGGADNETNTATTEAPVESNGVRDVGETTDTPQSSDAENNGGEQTEPVEEAGVTVGPQTVNLTEETVKLLGRTQKMLDGNLMCALSGSGVEFDYTGKNFSVTFVGDTTAKEGNDDNAARVAIYVNGERTQDMMLTGKVTEVTILESAEEVTAHIQIVKLSESGNSIFAIKPIKLGEGEKITVAKPKTHTIEFVGDSITCGYGVDDENSSHHFSTTTEDVTKTYAYKTAQMMDADYSFVSFSGHGIISGYTSDSNKKVTTQLVPDLYDKVGSSYGKLGANIQPQTLKWDFAKFVPEAIVINLGTNDASYTKTDATKQREYIDGYVAFLKNVRELNPNAEIFCALGVMGQDLCDAMKTACEEYTAETGDTKVHSVKLSVQDQKLGLAADWHPTEANHERAALELAEQIKLVMGW